MHPRSRRVLAGTPATSTLAATLSTAQKQFLTIETVGKAQSAAGLVRPGRVTFRPPAQSSVGVTVAGRVVAQLVRAGEAVKAGTPVVIIESVDASTARTAVDVAATRLAAAESVHRRNVEMVEKGVGLESEKHEAEARLKEARSEHERARQAVALIGAGPLLLNGQRGARIAKADLEIEAARARRLRRQYAGCGSGPLSSPCSPHRKKKCKSPVRSRS